MVNTMHINDLTLEQLDYWVARAKDMEVESSADGYTYRAHPSLPPRKWAPSRYWSQGGPIIEEARIDLNWDWEQSSEWTASMEPEINAQGSSALVAAMRAYVLAKVGEELNAAH